MDIRAKSRMTGLDTNTILRLMVQEWEQCFQFLADTMPNVKATDIQCNEVFSFVGCKEKTAFLQNTSEETLGTPTVSLRSTGTPNLFFAFTSVARAQEDAALFADKLTQCCSNSIHPHVSADGYNPYQTAIPAAFAHRVDHGMLIKRFGGPWPGGRRRYSPATIIGVKNYQNAGTSKPGHLRTSRIERSTLTIPLHNRRWARLTDAFGKSSGKITN